MALGLNLLKITGTAQQLSDTPFSPGFNAVLINGTAGSLVVQGSATDSGYATLATLGAAGTATAMAQVTLPIWIKVSTAATVDCLA
jgi:hypothetical protein